MRESLVGARKGKRIKRLAVRNGDRRGRDRVQVQVLRVELPLAVVADESVELDAYCRESKARAGETVDADAVLWQLPQLVEQLLRFFLATHRCFNRRYLGSFKEATGLNTRLDGLQLLQTIF